MAKRLRSFRPVEVVRGGKTTILTPRASGAGLFAPEQYLRRRTRGGDGTVIGTAPGIDAALALGLKRVMGQIDKGLEELPPERVEAMARALRQGDNERVEAEVLRKIPERRLLEEAVRDEIRRQFEHKPGLARELGRQSDFIKNAADRVLLDYVQQRGSPIESALTKGGMTPRREGGSKVTQTVVKPSKVASGAKAVALEVARKSEEERLLKMQKLARDLAEQRLRVPLIGRPQAAEAQLSPAGRVSGSALEEQLRARAAVLREEAEKVATRPVYTGDVLAERGKIADYIKARGIKTPMQSKVVRDMAELRLESIKDGQRRTVESLRRQAAELEERARDLAATKAAASRLSPADVEELTVSKYAERAKPIFEKYGIPLTRENIALLQDPEDLQRRIDLARRNYLEMVEKADKRKGADPGSTRFIPEYRRGKSRGASKRIDYSQSVLDTAIAKAAALRQLNFDRAMKAEALIAKARQKLMDLAGDLDRATDAQQQAEIIRQSEQFERYVDGLEYLAQVRDSGGFKSPAYRSGASIERMGKGVARVTKFARSAEQQAIRKAAESIILPPKVGFTPFDPTGIPGAAKAVGETKDALRLAVARVIAESTKQAIADESGRPVDLDGNPEKALDALKGNRTIGAIASRIYGTLSREEAMSGDLPPKAVTLLGKLAEKLPGQLDRAYGVARSAGGLVRYDKTGKVTFDYAASQKDFADMYAARPQKYLKRGQRAKLGKGHYFKGERRELNHDYFHPDGTPITLKEIADSGGFGLSKRVPEGYSDDTPYFNYRVAEWDKRELAKKLKPEAASEEVEARQVILKPGTGQGFVSVAEKIGARVRADNRLLGQFYEVMKSEPSKRILKEARRRAREDLVEHGWEASARGEAAKLFKQRIEELVPFYTAEIMQDTGRPPTAEEQARRAIVLRAVADGDFKLPTLKNLAPPSYLPEVAKVSRVPLSDKTLEEMAFRDAVARVQAQVDSARGASKRSRGDDAIWEETFEELLLTNGKAYYEEHLTNLRRLRQKNEERLRLRKGGGGFRSAAERDAELTKAITEAAAAGPAKKPDLVAAATSPRMVERMRAQYDLLKKKDKLNAGEKLTLAQLEVNLKRVGALDGLGFLGTDGFAMVGNAVAYGIGGLAVYALYRAVVKRS